jgi:hypothetical protein
MQVVTYTLEITELAEITANTGTEKLAAETQSTQRASIDAPPSIAVLFLG